MKQQITDTIMMVRPKYFGYNTETAVDNAFQSSEGAEKSDEIKSKAVAEFDAFVDKLRDKGINVVVIEDLDEPITHDAIFPNNWISFHDDGWIITYPMFSKMRRKERREDIVEGMMKKFGFERRFSFEHYEEEGSYLEGTGSLVLDRINRIAYASISVRTDVTVLDKWAVLCNYRTCIFQATDREGNPIYHTNVLMAMGVDFVVICMDAIKDYDQRSELGELFKKTGKEIITITLEQMESFAGNMLQIKGGSNDYLVMSTQAFDSLSVDQVDQFQKHSSIIHSDISTIEKYGGGSVRCMMAEIFYPKR